MWFRKNGYHLSLKRTEFDGESTNANIEKYSILEYDETSLRVEIDIQLNIKMHFKGYITVVCLLRDTISIDSLFFDEIIISRLDRNN